MRRPEHQIKVLHGFRALMILFVANFHIYQQSWLGQVLEIGGIRLDFTAFTATGYLFVDGLLLLSAFLLFLPYTQKSTDPSLIGSPWDFWFRRCRRILPSYEIAILLSFLLVALPTGAYVTTGSAVWDLLSHICFLQMFSKNTYLFSPLNGAVWTIVVEMQFYLVFPFLARLVQKKPAIVLPTMAIVSWIYRFCVARFCEDTSALINQFPAYLDVFALGMAGAMLYSCIKKELLQSGKKKQRITAAISLLAFVAGCICIWQLTKIQYSEGTKGYEMLRLSQMKLELPFAAAILLAMLGAAFSPQWLQWLLGNRLMFFLSGISMNFYIWHQLLAVQIRLKWFPDANALHSSLPSQTLYTLVCYLSALTVAMIFTYGIEKPAAAGMTRIRQLIRKKG